jgi:hypothetical protein
MIRLIYLLISLFIFNAGEAQLSKKKVYKVGILTSLYLDSAFKADKFQFNNNIPKNFLKGLDFATGARLAIDSMQTPKDIEIVFSIYDIQSKTHSIQKLKDDHFFDSLNLIIGNVSGAEFRQIANICCPKNIPFISVTYPNDAGVTNCPSTIILNPTIPVHCEAMYQYMLTNEPVSNKVYLTKSGQLETRIKSIYEKLNKGSGAATLLKWKDCLLTDTAEILNINPVIKLLDSTKDNTIICGSLDEKFSAKIIKAVASLTSYRITLIGMPSWETLPELNSKESEGTTICYSTSFYASKKESDVNFEERFFKLTSGKPSELAYKAFETTIYFSDLLINYGNQLPAYLTEPSKVIFTPFNIKPVYNQNTTEVNYLENKKVHLIKQEKGIKTEILLK